MSCNNKFTPEEKESITMRQAFATAGKNFEVFDDTQKTVIVPYGKGAEIINDILTDRFSKDLIWARDILKSAKDYSVNLFNDQFKKLSECGAIYSNKDKTIFILMPNFYDEHLGIIREEGDIKKWNTLIL